MVHFARLVSIFCLSLWAIFDSSHVRGQEDAWSAEWLKVSDDESGLLVVVLGDLGTDEFMVWSGGEIVDQATWHGVSPFVKYYLIKPGKYRIKGFNYDKDTYLEALPSKISVLQYTKFDNLKPQYNLSYYNDGLDWDYFDDVGYFKSLDVKPAGLKNDVTDLRGIVEPGRYSGWDLLFFARRPIPKPDVPDDDETEGGGQN